MGSALARESLKKGYEVCLYDSLKYEQDANEILKKIGSTELIIGDTRNKELLANSLKRFKPDFVVHFAELSGVYVCNHNPILTENINYKASKGVIDVCEKLKIKVLYNSSSSVYGDTDNYVKFKLKMEEYVKGKNVIVFRPATVFGLSPRMRMELLLNHFTYMALKGKITISRPDDYRAAIDIDDLITGYLKVLEKGKWDKQIYNIGHFNFSKLQFAQRIAEVIPCEIAITDKIYDTRSLQIDCSDFNKEFDFEPVIPYGGTIKKVSGWLRENLDILEKTDFTGNLNVPFAEWKRIC